ncbi:MAG: hypothetical protein CVU65_04955 [Deltaproteobacteria bacterium HGW-Deltaproteobacteria-22]|jgi:hypothetical protein|nr:MAG: hypothetical protein CVU65_04955 [Deltaproteobacteria bacterium HGW-Deltaproteobacteria-22]
MKLRLIALGLLWLPAACGPAWLPARPARFARLHGTIDRLELAINKDGDLRKNSLRETVAQTRDINGISAERFLFGNAVARLWSKLFQDLELLDKTLETSAQGIDYIEKKTLFEKGRLDENFAEFNLRFDTVRGQLAETLCMRNPKAALCQPAADPQEKTP